MSGQLYYRKRGIRVTSSNFEIHGGAYPLSSIQSVQIRTIKPNHKGPVICLVIGGVLTLTVLGSVIGVPLVIAGLIWLLRQKPLHWLVLKTDVSTSEPYSSKDLQMVKEIASALSAAIARNQGSLKILSAAKAKEGRISVTDAVLATGLDFAEVETMLKGMVSSGYAEMENDLTTGVLLYWFKEL